MEETIRSNINLRDPFKIPNHVCIYLISNDGKSISFRNFQDLLDVFRAINRPAWIGWIIYQNCFGSEYWKEKLCSNQQNRNKYLSSIKDSRWSKSTSQLREGTRWYSLNWIPAKDVIKRLSSCCWMASHLCSRQECDISWTQGEGEGYYPPDLQELKCKAPKPQNNRLR